MSQWQPIETAPRDGSMILGWDGYEYFVTNYMMLSGAWSFGEDRYEVFDWNPSHWMPLPEPPTTQPEIQKGNEDLVPLQKCPECSGGKLWKSWAGNVCPRCLGTGRVGQ